MNDVLSIEFANNVVSTIYWDLDTFAHNRATDTQWRVIVDSNVRWYYDEYLSPKVGNATLFEFYDPEESKKTEQSVHEIHEFLFREMTERIGVVVAIGGGVTLDTAGYAASTFKRGVDWIAVPTTLLAQVDASVGGKTGINHGLYGKNVIGTFHPPGGRLHRFGVLDDLDRRTPKGGSSRDV